MKPFKTTSWIVFVSVTVLVVSAAAGVAAAQSPARVLNKEERIARNYALARKFYDAYVNMHETGYPDAFKAEDWEKNAEQWYFDRTPGKQGYVDAKRRWKRFERVKQEDWKDADRIEYRGVLKALPDWEIVTPFKGFCDEEGCAWQMNAGGHDSTGKYLEVNEVEFMWTNKYGKIERVEVFSDWVNTPDFLAGIAGVSPCSVTLADFGDAVRKLDRVPANDVKAASEK